MFEWFQKKQASRKYVDLIMDASSKWANWDPPKTIQAGDFGTINRESGQFERIGNIYTYPDTADIARKHPVNSRPAEEVYVIHSHYSKKVEGNAGASTGAPDVADANFSTEIKFDKRRGAFLVMHNPCMSVVPDEFCRETLGIDLFNDRKIALITEAFTCDGFVLYLSSKKTESIRVSLKAEAGPHVEGEVNGIWLTEGGSGNFRRGYRKGAYTPLYLLKSVQPPPPKRRESPDPNAVEGDRWNEMEVPWDFLDSDGDEEPEEEFSD
ncbi:uncharacterized protein PHACADRAFT_253181 [Phanerochaete carnosa HHB-10118-sp]|uniref:Uncharacterized protein n=1 Tax=Phanerochaete carnosa (strain HHB-10118-sp) TaxID=650164 RepID=K5WHU7_PHACS|nr:uncharacterized protein PHACADRAFT_253181 [Phanerochaete carnosa HHB-10118-sp]EKM58694.1 hypothetical protein PHACADRAFT_253181 [Phanerochaete carnosa HHB-10118-sp]